MNEAIRLVKATTKGCAISFKKINKDLIHFKINADTIYTMDLNNRDSLRFMGICKGIDSAYEGVFDILKDYLRNKDE